MDVQGISQDRIPMSPRPKADPKHRVLIVDDHPIMRRGIRETLSAEPSLEVCGEAGGRSEALALLQAEQPDLLVLDLSLAGMSDLGFLKEIRTLGLETKVLVLTMHDENVFAERALRAGALGYVSKVTAAEELLEAVRTVLRGEIWLSAAMTGRMLKNAVGVDVQSRARIETLSDREIEVLELLGQGLGTREVAKKLHRSMKTIESHRENIKRKLDLKSGSDLIRFAALWVRRRS